MHWLVCTVYSVSGCFSFWFFSFWFCTCLQILLYVNSDKMLTNATNSFHLPYLHHLIYFNFIVLKTKSNKYDNPSTNIKIWQILTFLWLFWILKWKLSTTFNLNGLLQKMFILQSVLDSLLMAAACFVWYQIRPWKKT